MLRLSLSGQNERVIVYSVASWGCNGNGINAYM